MPWRPRLIDPAGKPATPLRELGHGRLARLLYLLHRLLQRCSGGRAGLQAYVLAAQPVAPAPAPLRPSDQIRCEAAGPDSPWLASFPRPAAVIRGRFERGAECHVVSVRGEFAGHLWLARGCHDEDEVRCRYQLPAQPAGVWDYDVYIEPRFRLTRALHYLWGNAAAELASQGVRWTFSRISLFNVASLAAHERLGATRVGLALFLTLGPLQISWTPGPRRLQVCSARGTPPVVQLQPPPDAAAVVIGLDSHGLAAARALARAGVPVYALKRDLSLPGVLSRHVAGVLPVRSYDAADLLPALAQLRRWLPQHTRLALLAINDRHVETIARHLDRLQGAYHIAWAASAPAVLRLQRKDELEAHCRRCGLRYPRSAILGSEADTALLAGFGYPVILKPVKPQSSFKTLLAHGAAELAPLLRPHAEAWPVLAQEYIAGGDEQLYFGALMLDQGRVLQAMAGRKIASHPPARGQTTIAETVDAAEVIELSARFFAGTGISGPASLELKRDAQGRWWVIEPTVGRSDFWLELCVSAGFNLPLQEFGLALGLPRAPGGPGGTGRATGVVWYDTERDPLAHARLCWRERTLRPRGKRQVFPYAGQGDAWPFWRAAWRLASRRLRRQPQPGPARPPEPRSVVKP